MMSDSTGHWPDWNGFGKWLGNTASTVGRFVGGAAIATVGLASMMITAPLALIPGAGMLFNASLSLTMYGGFMMASSWDNQILADMNAIGWNPFNSNADLAANANRVSFYKGQSIIHTDAFGGTFSFGVMFIDSSWHGDANTIRHEWGHFAQLNLMGWGNYIALVAIPSVYYNKTANYTDRSYYSKIWERTADWLGGARSSSTYDSFWSWRNFVPW